MEQNHKNWEQYMDQHREFIKLRSVTPNDGWLTGVIIFTTTIFSMAIVFISLFSFMILGDKIDPLVSQKLTYLMWFSMGYIAFLGVSATFARGWKFIKYAIKQLKLRREEKEKNKPSNTINWSEYDEFLAAKRSAQSQVNQNINHDPFKGY